VNEEHRLKKTSRNITGTCMSGSYVLIGILNRAEREK
jgi:hypothetical protein